MIPFNPKYNSKNDDLINRSVCSGESGRTMLEMFGVLAVVGVLSVCTVWGFRLAINRNTSNEVINDLNQRAIVVNEQVVRGVKVDLSEFNNSDITWKDENEGDASGFFSVTMKLSDGEIETLQQMNWDLPYEVYIDGIPMDDYDAKTGGVKERISLETLFIKPAFAATTEHEVKFIFHKGLDPMVKPDKISQDECAQTGGKWDGKRCFCPVGSYMTTTGCVIECGGDETGVKCPDETICYRNSECLDCMEVCQEGKCVPSERYTQTYCRDNQVIAFVSVGSKATHCLENDILVDDCNEKAQLCQDNNGRAACETPACVGEEACECTTQGDTVGCKCVYGGDFPSCMAKPDCLDDKRCLCEDGSCRCVYGGTYPDCESDAELQCIQVGHVWDSQNSVCCADPTVNEGCCAAYGYTWDDQSQTCSKDSPACLKNGTCECQGDCWCIYGGEYPNNCDAKPDCLTQNTCTCTGGDITGALVCECTYGGIYPNCQTKPDCIDSGLCTCNKGSCSCVHGGIYPNCEAEETEEEKCAQAGHVWDSENGICCGAEFTGTAVCCMAHGYTWDGATCQQGESEPVACNEVGCACGAGGLITKDNGSHLCCDTELDGNGCCPDYLAGCDGTCGSGKVIGCDGICGSGKIEGCDGKCGSGATMTTDNDGHTCCSATLNDDGCCGSLARGCDGMCGSGKVLGCDGKCGSHKTMTTDNGGNVCCETEIQPYGCCLGHMMVGGVCSTETMVEK